MDGSEEGLVEIMGLESGEVNTPGDEKGKKILLGKPVGGSKI